MRSSKNSMMLPLEPFPSKPEPLTQIQRVVSEKVNKFIVKTDIKVNCVWIHVYKNTFFELVSTLSSVSCCLIRFSSPDMKSVSTVSPTNHDKSLKKLLFTCYSVMQPVKYDHFII